MAATPAKERRTGDPEVDRAVRVTLAEDLAEIAGAVLMDVLGPFAVEEAQPGSGGRPDRPATLVFYPGSQAATAEPSTAEEVLAALSPTVVEAGQVGVEVCDVPRDWVEGWRDYFRPLVVGGVRIRPPWEPPLQRGGAVAQDGVGRGPGVPGGRAPVEVVIDPGLGFGTGLHPTTRGALQLLQRVLPEGTSAPGPRPAPGSEGDRSIGEDRRLVDAGTGSGILAVAAAKLGWGRVIAFDNDPLALVSTRENVKANAVEEAVEIHEVDVAAAPAQWFAGATVVANMTLQPVLTLLRRLASATSVAAAAPPAGAAPPAEGGRSTGAGPASGGPLRLVVSGILAGGQEYELVQAARECGFRPGRRLYEAEWVSLELLPAGPYRG
ncbi:MAG: 50S ribosomal protein L11 methyltransferase [Actinomycetia bacterium]|nr:50S ribosomal protein L11 methyltransferase [Actinomycetes bacterium]